MVRLRMVGLCHNKCYIFLCKNIEPACYGINNNNNQQFFITCNAIFYIFPAILFIACTVIVSDEKQRTMPNGEQQKRLED
jgi:hypothetical protein